MGTCSLSSCASPWRAVRDRGAGSCVSAVLCQLWAGLKGSQVGFHPRLFSLGHSCCLPSEHRLRGLDTLPCIPAASFEMPRRICCSLHPPPAEHIWRGWMPPCHLPLRHCLRLGPFCCFTAQLAPHDLFHPVLSEPHSAIIVALKNSGFQYNKVNQYQHCNRWWPLTSFRNFTSFFLLCFSLHLITWSIIPNKNQWDYITTNYC